MKLCITIDTEEDNWGDYDCSSYTLQNIERIPRLQELFDEFNVKPTYLITFPVATDDRSVAILKKYLDDGRCEIGTHCHPWNTPPFEEERTVRNSMLCNLPGDLQSKKIESLHNVIGKNFEIEPISFRAGRWGYSSEIVEILHRLGYKIETSITPLIDWTDYHGPDFSDIYPIPFRFSGKDSINGLPDCSMVEVPVTVGFLQKNLALCNKISNFCEKEYIRKFRLKGILDRLSLVEKVWLCPEVSDHKAMIRLAQNMMRNKHKLLNMSFHSVSLKRGLNGFVKTEEDERQFIKRIREFLIFARDEGIESIGLSDVTSLL